MVPKVVMKTHQVRSYTENANFEPHVEMSVLVWLAQWRGLHMRKSSGVSGSLELIYMAPMFVELALPQVVPHFKKWVRCGGR